MCWSRLYPPAGGWADVHWSQERTRETCFSSHSESCVHVYVHIHCTCVYIKWYLVCFYNVWLVMVTSALLVCVPASSPQCTYMYWLRSLCSVPCRCTCYVESADKPAISAWPVAVLSVLTYRGTCIYMYSGLCTHKWGKTTYWQQWNRIACPQMTNIAVPTLLCVCPPFPLDCVHYLHTVMCYFLYDNYWVRHKWVFQ